jgi:hypothetical protein
VLVPTCSPTPSSSRRGRSFGVGKTAGHDLVVSVTDTHRHSPETRTNLPSIVPQGSRHSTDRSTASRPLPSASGSSICTARHLGRQRGRRRQHIRVTCLSPREGSAASSARASVPANRSCCSLRIPGLPRPLEAYLEGSATTSRSPATELAALAGCAGGTGPASVVLDIGLPRLGLDCCRDQVRTPPPAGTLSSWQSVSRRRKSAVLPGAC